MNVYNWSIYLQSRNNEIKWDMAKTSCETQNLDEDNNHNEKKWMPQTIY